MAISKVQILFFFLCDMMFTRVASLPTGAPSRACSDMLPRHSGTRPQSAQTSPFSLSQPTAYFPGQASSISVVSNDPSRTIRGLLLQARRVGDGAPNGANAIVGTWNLINGENDGYRLTECSHPDDTVTHRHRNNDTEVLFLWRAPEDLTSGVQFMVTVVESFTSYWPQLTSDQVIYPAGQSSGVSLPCDSSPCQNDGTCSNNGQLFFCTCLAGFEGLLCENEAPRVVPCDSQPCLNGGTCFNLGLEEHSPFVCTCADGYGGMNCQTVSSPCNSFPCQNGGTCSSNGQFFTCSCHAGFEGTLCEREVSLPCDSSPCQNGGMCSNNGQLYSCTCLAGFEGLLCEREVPRMAPCDSQPCLNGGSCFNLGLEEHSPFLCMCADGYDGMTCQTATDPCHSDPCANDGFCFSSDDGNMFLCLCVGHFSGPTCDETVSTGTDPCVESPCQNGGTCVINDDFTTTSCMCPSGYSGFSCETAVCPEGYCQNLATCRVLNGANSCFCGTGFTGIRCETRITPCNSNPCTAGGTCNEGGNGGFQCMCPEGRQGVRCETAVCPHGYCSNGGSCFVTMETRGDVGERFECSCAPGFTGERCGSDINECASAPCQNNGSCVDGIDVFYCDCQPGFGGPFCEHCYNLCLPDCEANFKCENYGTCVYSEADGEVFCDCLPGYMGSKCEIDIDECASTPCQNNGSCVDGIDEFHCDCQPGFGGPFCEHCYNLCLPDCEANFKCENYGTCVYSEADGEVFCDCLPGYMGSKCEIDINECASTPCQNNGSCVDGIDEFYCDCQPGFGGPFCEHCYNLCLPDCAANFKCQNYGTCIFRETEGSVFCDCLPGYAGSRCEIEKDECESNPCPDGSVCIDYIDGYQCKCVRGSKPGCENTAAPAEACTDADRCPAGSECIDLFGGFFCICPEGEKDDSMCGKFIEVEVEETPRKRPSGVNRPFRYG